MSFLSTAAYGVLYLSLSDPRLRDNSGVLAPLGEKVWHFVDTAGFMKIDEGCDIDRTMADLAYLRSAEVNWEDFSMVFPVLLYDFKTGMVAGFGRWCTLRQSANLRYRI